MKKTYEEPKKTYAKPTLVKAGELAKVAAMLECKFISDLGYEVCDG